MPQGEHFDRATANAIVKKVVNTTQMEPTYASCFCIYSAGTHPWLRPKQFTRLFHLELYGAGCERGDSTPTTPPPVEYGARRDGLAEGQILPSRPRARELLEDLFQGHRFPAVSLVD